MTRRKNMEIRRFKISLTALLVLLLIGMSHSVVGAETTIFYTDESSQTINSSNEEGTISRVIRSGIQVILDIEYHPVLDKIYWSEASNTRSGGAIRRSNTDGSGLETIIPWPMTGNAKATNIEFDLNAEKMYWTDSGTVGIYRSNLDGTFVEQVLNVRALQDRTNWGTGPGQSYEFAQVSGLALDFESGQMFWADYFGGDIHVSDFNGNGIIQLASGMKTPRGMTVSGGKVYWTTGGFGNKIWRANIDGTEQEIIVSKNLGTRLKYPFDIEVDPTIQQIYWTDRETGFIQRSNLDGTNVITVISVEFLKKGKRKPGTPTGLALKFDPTGTPPASPTLPTPPSPIPTPSAPTQPTSIAIPEVASASYKESKGEWKFVTNMSSAVGPALTIDLVVYDPANPGVTQTITANESTDPSGAWTIKVKDTFLNGISGANLFVIAKASNGTESSPRPVSIK